MRAMRPNQYWHIDVTLIRLIIGVKVYLHAVIDNFSRRILAWRLAERLDPLTTCEVLAEAGKAIVDNRNVQGGDKAACGGLSCRVL